MPEDKLIPTEGEVKDEVLLLMSKLRGWPPEHVALFIEELLDHVCIGCGYVDLPKYGNCPSCLNPEGCRMGQEIHGLSEG
jgi:hypothetical protein